MGAPGSIELVMAVDINKRELDRLMGVKQHAFHNGIAIHLFQKIVAASGFDASELTSGKGIPKFLSTKNGKRARAFLYHIKHMMPDAAHAINTGMALNTMQCKVSMKLNLVFPKMFEFAKQQDATWWSFTVSVHDFEGMGDEWTRDGVLNFTSVDPPHITAAISTTIPTCAKPTGACFKPVIDVQGQEKCTCQTAAPQRNDRVRLQAAWAQHGGADSQQ